MKHNIGLNNYQLKKDRVRTPVVWDTLQTINSHMQISGMTGSGKSHELKRMIRSAAEANIEVDIFDVHADLSIPGITKEVIISESTRHGYNLLTLNPDAHSGGVRKKINWIIDLINSTSRKLGTKQESALRNLLRDVYYLNGCYEDEASSWLKQEINEQTRKELIKARDYASLKKYYPTIDDLLSYAERKVTALYVGGDNATVSAIEKLNSLANTLHRLTSAGRKAHDDEAQAKLEAKLEKAKAEAIETFDKFVNKMQTGRELQDVMKYNSKDVLQSVIERIEMLNSSGIFRPNPPPFGGAKVRVHNIKSLSEDEQRMYIYTRCEAIFRERKDRGQVNGLEHVILVDEAHNFFTDEKENILNTISKEARKFGIGLWAASQSPTHFSDDFLSACGAILLLYIHPLYWDLCSRKLNIDKDALKYLRPGEVGAIKLQKRKEYDARFIHVFLDQSEANAA